MSDARRKCAKAAIITVGFVCANIVRVDLDCEVVDAIADFFKCQTTQLM
jgi:hypothetical protein